MAFKKKKIGNEVYEATVLQIESWDELGRPTKCIIRYDEETIDLRDPQQSRHFLIAFVAQHMKRPVTKGSA